MELNHLKYFFVVAREGGFTRAAKVLRVQQPTISKMVRRLEEDLKLSLLERTRHGIQMTKAGADIMNMCEDIFSRIDAIQALSEVEKTECAGLLSFGMTDSVASYILPSILREFLKIHPKVRPSIFAGSSNLICSEIAEGRIEFGVSYTRPDRDDFRVENMAEVPFQLVVAATQQKNAALRQRFIISRDIDYPKARPFPVLEMLQRNRVKVDSLIASNNLDAQKQMVLQGLGVALLPRFMVKQEISRGSLVALYPKKNFVYTLKLITRIRKVLSRNAVVFLDEFRTHLSELL